MKLNKKEARIRRATRTRNKIKELGTIRLVVHRTARHIYAQIISSNGAEVLVSASTLDKDIADKLHGKTSNKDAVMIVGKIIAQRALKKGIQHVSFDRSGFKYHGRIRSLAASARAAGLQF